MSVWKSFSFLSTLLLFVSACTPRQAGPSDAKTSREGRAALGVAEDISDDFLATIAEAELAQDWLKQNQTAKGLWKDLNQPTSKRFARWQTWYSKEDLQRVFRIAYQNIGPDARRVRRAFTPEEMQAALLYHDQTQFTEASWDKDNFGRWLAKYEGKANAIPGLNKVLMNRTALLTLLSNYQAIDLCARNQAESLPCPGLKFQFPRGSAFIKTSWRRAQSQGDFKVPYYQTADLMTQLSADEWQISSEGIPLTVNAERMETPTNQVFHLVAVHVTLKLDEKWFWTSHWLDDKNQKEKAEYRSCSTLDFFPLAREDREEFEGEVAKAEALTGLSWCSNPYLEGGLSNHRTNCIGCHQHAGTPWTEDDFTERLQNDLQVLISDAEVKSKSDRVWSLLNGPEPLVSYISQEIDYFDVYDL